MELKNSKKKKQISKWTLSPNPQQLYNAIRKSPKMKHSRNKKGSEILTLSPNYHKNASPIGQFHDK